MARDYDVVLFGATGFTGGLTAHYLATHAPAGLRWAIAGRNRAKLDQLREDLGTSAPDIAAAGAGVPDVVEAGVSVPDVVEADVDDPASLRRLAANARVVASTVGPYLRYGEPLVAACAEAGTDYADLTGEPEFVDRMYLAYHETAVRTGARLVHACGFDSIPHDLGAQFTVQQLDADLPIRLRGYVRAGGSVSGGTFASAVNAFARLRQAGAAHRDRTRAEAGRAPSAGAAAPSAGERRARAVAGRAGFDRTVGKWVLPLPTIDPQIVVRSARALAEYGPDFRYSHFVALRSPFAAAGLTFGAGAAMALAQLPPTRALLLKARPAGTGPTAEQRKQGWFTVRFVAHTAGEAAQPLVTEVAGGDPGYGETAKMLAESVLCLAGDQLPATAGQVTTAVAMGAVLRARLERAGITFKVLSPSTKDATAGPDAAASR